LAVVDEELDQGLMMTGLLERFDATGKVLRAAHRGGPTVFARCRPPVEGTLRTG
jgi:hypothetical protein